MKRLVFTLSLFMMCAGAYASQDFVVDTSDADMLMDKRTEIQDNLSADYEKLLAQVNELDPSYARYLGSQNNLSTEQKLQKLRSWAAQKAFEYYEKLFRDEMDAKSRQTGRKIQSALYGSASDFQEYLTWLDRGELDTEKCRRDGWNVCKYPDGFQEYSTRNVTVQKDGRTYYKMSFDKDLPDKNATNWCDVEMEVAEYNNVSDDISSTTTTDEHKANLEVSCTIYHYDDYYAWKNQEVEDTIAGKYDVVEVKDYGGPFEKVYITRAQEKDWKSNYLPTYQIKGYDISTSSTSKTTKSKL